MRFRQALASCTVLGLSFADWGDVLVHVPAPAAWQLEGMLLAPQQAFAILVTPTEALVLTGRYPQDWTLTYFRSVPHSLYWPMWAISILAAIIASQVGRAGSISLQYTSKQVGHAAWQTACPGCRQIRLWPACAGAVPCKQSA